MMTAAACNLQRISRMLLNNLYFSSNGNIFVLESKKKQQQRIVFQVKHKRKAISLKNQEFQR